MRHVIVTTLLIAALLTITPAAAADRWTGDGISWETPEGWTPKQGSSEFRFAEINLGDELVLVVSRFPGNVGGTLANVNRWRGQLQLPPIGAAELEKAVKKVQAGEATALVADIKNEAGDQRMLGAILADDAAKRTWFFKVTGPAKAVEDRVEKFHQLIQSVRLGAAGAK